MDDDDDVNYNLSFGDDDNREDVVVII